MSLLFVVRLDNDILQPIVLSFCCWDDTTPGRLFVWAVKAMTLPWHFWQIYFCEVWMLQVNRQRMSFACPWPKYCTFYTLLLSLPSLTSFATEESRGVNCLWVHLTLVRYCLNELFLCTHKKLACYFTQVDVAPLLWQCFTEDAVSFSVTWFAMTGITRAFSLTHTCTLTQTDTHIHATPPSSTLPFCLSPEGSAPLRSVASQINPTCFSVLLSQIHIPIVDSNTR